MVTTLRPTSLRSPADSAAGTIAPLLALVFSGPPPVRFEFWDGSAAGAEDAPGTIRFRSPDALRRALWSPDELGLGRAYVAGDADLDGDVVETMRALEVDPPNGRTRVQILREAVRAARALGVVGPPPPPPPEEARVRGRLHSPRRDAQAISHHYDVGNDFYRLVLGPTLTYSCARWGDATHTLDEAQAAKHDLVCCKLGLPGRPGLRLLDVGCGWGSLATHAAQEYGAAVVGVTISEEQRAAAQARVAAAGVDDRVEIRLQDYRDLRGETFDAVSSVGMFEHVGAARMADYFRTIRALVRPGGRFLNHAISKVGGSRLGRRSFVGRYVFPDGELIDVSDVVGAFETAGFEVRDVESLREHYAQTLRAWIANLEEHWDDAVREVGDGRARVWRAYMAGSVVGFEVGRISIHQVLGVVPDAGRSGMPWRRDW
ncbi:MAG: class I SAM-dependent methyltransferase [Acidimicrobiia bacterium]